MVETNKVYGTAGVHSSDAKMDPKADTFLPKFMKKLDPTGIFRKDVSAGVYTRTGSVGSDRMGVRILSCSSITELGPVRVVLDIENTKGLKEKDLLDLITGKINELTGVPAGTMQADIQWRETGKAANIMVTIPEK